MTTTRGNGAADTESQTARAEELVDDVTHRVDDWSDKVADWVARAAERTREEVEDVWAEAQSIRRRM
jgi:hypothetical protein